MLHLNRFDVDIVYSNVSLCWYQISLNMTFLTIIILSFKTTPPIYIKTTLLLVVAIPFWIADKINRHNSATSNLYFKLVLSQQQQNIYTFDLDVVWSFVLRYYPCKFKIVAVHSTTICGKLIKTSVTCSVVELSKGLFKRIIPVTPRIILASSTSDCVCSRETAFISIEPTAVQGGDLLRSSSEF